MANLTRRGILGMFGALAALPIVGPALSRIIPPIAPKMTGGRLMYSNRVIRSYMDVQAIQDRNFLLQPSDYAGEPYFSSRNIPIRIVDELVGDQNG